jgi:hypothetical protein
MWLGVKFIVGGDFNQQTPIGEVWGEEAVLRLERSAALHYMCNGLRLEHSTCYRSDRAHFNVYAKNSRHGKQHELGHDEGVSDGPVPLGQ